MTENPLITRAEFREMTGLSRTSEWRLVASGNAPDMVIAGDTPLGYSREAVYQWFRDNTKPAKMSKQRGPGKLKDGGCLNDN